VTTQMSRFIMPLRVL